MTSRRSHSPFAAFLSCLFGLLLLIGAPVRPIQASSAPMGDEVTTISAMADDFQSDADADYSGQCTFDDNSGGMDDILHPFNTPRLWASLPSQPPATGPYDVGQYASARLLRPPEAA